VDPRKNPVAKGVKENVYAFGDCCLTSLQESKCVISIVFLTDYIVSNLLQVAHGRAPSHQIPSRLANLSPISLGPNIGIMVFNGLVMMNPAPGKGKFEVTDKYGKIMAGDVPTFTAFNKQNKGF
jgi:hypothetical protein